MKELVNCVIISLLQRWLKSDDLSCNEQNTKLMMFSIRNFDILPVIKFNDVSIKWLNHLKYVILPRHPKSKLQ